MAKLVSNVYGDALFQLAVEENKMDLLFEESIDILNVVLSNNEYLKFLNHPKISKEEKTKVTDEILAGRVSKDMVGFFHVIISKERYDEIKSIFAHFISKVKEHKKIGTAQVTSAIELTNKQKDAIREKLLTTTDYISIEMVYEVEPKIIGGMKIRIGDRVVDSTIQSKIEKMSKELYQIQLA